MQPIGPDDIRAAAEVHAELGPDYRDAVLESFLDRVNSEIDARVDQRLAAAQQPQAQRQRSFALAIASMSLGVPVTAIIGALANAGQATEVAVVWIAIAVINVAYAIGFRPPGSRR
jgi:acetyl-CoA acetyltransferase